MLFVEIDLFRFETHVLSPCSMNCVSPSTVCVCAWYLRLVVMSKNPECHQDAEVHKHDPARTYALAHANSNN